MSNPVATIGNTIPEPPDPVVIRETFTRIIYDAQKFSIYGDGEYDDTHATFDPEGKGDEFFMVVPMADVLTDWTSGPPPIKPDFVSDEAWEGLQKSGSAFVTAVNSVMPKIIIPSDILVDNGVKTPNGTFEGSYFERIGSKANTWVDLFSWELVSLNGTPIGAATTEVYKYAQVGPNYGSQYVSIKAKNDLEYINEFVLKLENPANPPLGDDHDWFLGGSTPDLTNLVVGRATTGDPVPGAFVLMLNVVPSRACSSSAEGTSKNPWTVVLEFGEVKMVIQDTGSTEVTLGNGIVGAEINKTTVNLAEGKAKGGPIQQQHINDKDPFVILVYPVWNGLVVASGIQDARATVFSSSYYVPKLKEASVLNSPYSNGFDPNNPGEVEVEVGTPGGSDYVMVDFGDVMTVTAKNCRFEIAYIPCFFSKKCWFDEYRIQSDDQPGVVTFAYNVYPIWTANGTASVLDPAPTVDETSYAGPIDGTIYCYTQWRLEQERFNRVAGEIFGSIFRIRETWVFPIKNGNGNFNVSYTGGGGSNRGDPSPSGDWTTYIQSISVTTNVDGSSGTITMDKYGFAGQQAEPKQSIGAITIAATGGFGTQAGDIFKGLAMGIADNQTVEGAVWTIPLMGLEKKMEDIALINVPFFDGEELSVVTDFLCRYAGLIDDMSYADPSVQLGVSDDVNVVRFDWKAGTTVRAALDEVMADTLHHYVVRDGKIFFYELNDITGLPINLGPDRSTNYPNAKVVMYDKTPDFEDMRNQIVVLGLEQVTDGQGADIEGMPTFPRTEVRKTTTDPEIPWAKVLVRPMPGYLDTDRIGELADKLAASLSKYELMGRTTIAGNADIKPYDRWGNFVIYGVTHNLDFKSKTWTTDLEFMRDTRVS